MAVLTKGKIKNYISKVTKIPREKMISDFKSIGLNLKGKSPDGKFMEFIDHRGNVRVKLHPYDRVTNYEQIHLYTKFNEPLSEGYEDKMEF